jgi:AraC-like DNA-binding protein
MSETSQTETPPAGVEVHAAGQLIERHCHAYDQLIYVDTGVLAIHTDRGAWVGSRDRAVWIPAGTWHQHRAYGATSVTTVGFAADTVLPDGTALPADVPPEGAPRGGTPSVLAADGLLRELLLAYTDPGLAPDESQRMRAVLRDRLSRARVRPLTLPAARDPRLAEACQLVAADLSRPRTLAWLASQVGAGERTLNRLYRGEFGMSYPQWRTSLRVFHAMIKLSGGATVTETAHACGWATASAFVDTFARTMGQTPGAYRRVSPGPPGRGPAAELA